MTNPRCTKSANESQSHFSIKITHHSTRKYEKYELQIQLNLQYHLFFFIFEGKTEVLGQLHGNQVLFLLRAISRAICLSSSGDGGLSASGGYSMYDLCNMITIKYDLEYRD